MEIRGFFGSIKMRFGRKLIEIIIAIVHTQMNVQRLGKRQRRQQERMLVCVCLYLSL